MRGPIAFAGGALLVIWGVLPLVPASWGIRFGAPYLVFFTLAALAAAGFFVLLNWGPVRQPESPAMTFASVLLVYVATVGGMVLFGNWYYPQFDRPRAAAPQAAGEAAIEQRGRAVFLNPAFACFACHTIEALGIRGGQRGPDLSNVGKLAGLRRPGKSAEDYLLEAIVDPWTCFTPLPASGLAECQPAADPAKTYPQLMVPGLTQRMSKEDLKDLIAFLKNLKEGK